MRKSIALLLLVLLPLQWSWALAAAYCDHGREHGHEQFQGHGAPASSAHFGHHGHASAPVPAQAQGPADDGALGLALDRTLDRTPDRTLDRTLGQTPDPASHHAHAVDDGAAGQAAGGDDAAHADCGLCHLGAASAVVPVVHLGLAPTSQLAPRTETRAWADSNPESLYRPPLTAG